MDWLEGCELMCSGLGCNAGRRKDTYTFFPSSISVNDMLSFVSISPFEKRT
jgi:hypothetical protein